MDPPLHLKIWKNALKKQIIKWMESTAIAVVGKGPNITIQEIDKDHSF